MRPLQSVQRLTGFETLEAKKLFAADLMGGAAIDLPDTAIVDGVVSHSPVAGSLSPASIGWVNANLGGQEGEDVTGDATTIVGGFKSASGVDSNDFLPTEDVTGDAATIVGGLVAEFDPGELASVQMNPADADVEFSARVFDGTGGFSYFGNLGGREGEDFNSQTDTNFDYPVGDFDVDGDVDGGGLVAEFDPGGLTSVR